MLADGPVPGWLDTFPLDPPPERVAVEDAVAITHEVLGSRPQAMEHLSQARAHRAAVGSLREDADTHGAT